MSKRLNDLINKKILQSRKLLSVFITAGFPEKDAAKDIVLQLDRAGVDFVELGIPFSDPVADGPVIQQASQTALENGIRLKDILESVREIRNVSDIPIILMGYLNPVFQYGLDDFFKDSAKAGADGFILPDWPIEESERYGDLLKTLDLDLIHLIAPNTDDERIKLIDNLSTSFIYCVAYTGVTGRTDGPGESQQFLEKLNRVLTKPHLIGFGVKNREDFMQYSKYADGVIIGSAFINMLKEAPAAERSARIEQFIKSIIG